MKKFFLLSTGLIFGLTMIAQGNSDNEHSKKIWDGTSDKSGKGPMLSKNQPAKVMAALQ